MQRTTLNSAGRRGKKVAQRGTGLSREVIESCRPSGAPHRFPVYPGLTPWATFLTRLTALSNSDRGDMDPLDSYQEFLERV